MRLPFLYLWSNVTLIFVVVAYGRLSDRSNLDAVSYKLHAVEASLAKSQTGVTTENVASNSSADLLGDLGNVLHVLQSTWYELWLGTWPTSIDWTGAVLNTHVITAIGVMSKALQPETDSLSTIFSENHINRYFAQSTAYYFGEDAAALRTEAYDDMLWVVLSWLEAIKFIRAHSERHYNKQWYGEQHIHVFAHRARVFYNLTTQGWTSDLCGGGMTWDPKFEPYKNAVTNQVFISASVGMYLHFPGDLNDSPSMNGRYKQHDKRFLDAAVRGYAWLKESNMTNTFGLYVDGFHISGFGRNDSDNTACDARNEMVYTYNQGIVLSGLHDLYKATGNVSYIADGHELVRKTIAATGWDLKTSRPKDTSSWQGLGRNGIMEEACDSTGSCSQDAHTFKSIYFHHLGSFCAPIWDTELRVPDLDKKRAARHRDQCKRYTLWVKHNANAALATRDKYGRIGTWWGASDSSTAQYHVPLARGSLDYRNDGQASRRVRRMLDGRTGRQSESKITKHASAKKHAAEAQRLIANRPVQGGDWNDRGRGRTVESHVGGLAVLRCLWELEQL